MLDTKLWPEGTYSTFLVKKDREGTGEIALASSERREVQRNSGICLNELDVRGQK